MRPASALALLTSIALGACGRGPEGPDADDTHAPVATPDLATPPPDDAATPTDAATPIAADAADATPPISADATTPVDADTAVHDAPLDAAHPQIGTTRVVLLEPHEDPLWTAADRRGGLFATPPGPPVADSPGHDPRPPSNQAAPARADLVPELVVGWWDDDLVVVAHGERILDERHPLRTRDDCVSRPTLSAVRASFGPTPHEPGGPASAGTLTLTFQRPRCADLVLEVPLPASDTTRLVPARSPVTAPVLGVFGVPAVTRDGMHLAVLLTSDAAPSGAVAVALALLRADDGSTLLEAPLIAHRDVTRDAELDPRDTAPLDRFERLSRALRGRFTPVRALLERAELRPLLPLASTSQGDPLATTWSDPLVTVTARPTGLDISGPGVQARSIELAARDLPTCAPGVKPCAPAACRASPTARGMWFDPELGTLLVSLDYGACRPERAGNAKLDFAPRLEWRVVALVRRR